jgi:hypothetical protein
MKKNVLRVVLAAELVMLLGSVALLASAGDGKRFVVAFRSNFTGPNSDAGTFSAAGAVSDSGNVTDTFTVTPTKDDEASLNGTQTLAGTAGTITTHFEGTIFPATAARSIAEGRAVIVSATGAYAGLTGKATFLGVVDSTTGTVTITEDWKAK